MKTLRYTASLALLGVALAAQSAEPSIALPAPKAEGRVSVESALKHRRSLRAPQAAPLTIEELGQLCWAAQGVTDSKGHRTASSAFATYPLELYVIAGHVTGLAPGLYHYLPAQHALALLTAGDLRGDFEKKAVHQAWISKAPALFVLSGTAARLKEARFLAIEVGLATQGFFLQAEARGLGSTFIGGFDASAARSALGLSTGEEVMAVLPVGRKP